MPQSWQCGSVNLGLVPKNGNCEGRSFRPSQRFTPKTRLADKFCTECRSKCLQVHASRIRVVVAAASKLFKNSPGAKRLMAGRCMSLHECQDCGMVPTPLPPFRVCNHAPGCKGLRFLLLSRNINQCHALAGVGEMDLCLRLHRDTFVLVDSETNIIYPIESTFPPSAQCLISLARMEANAALDLCERITNELIDDLSKSSGTPS